MIVEWSSKEGEAGVLVGHVVGRHGLKHLEALLAKRMDSLSAEREDDCPERDEVDFSMLLLQESQTQMPDPDVVGFVRSLVFHVVFAGAWICAKKLSVEEQGRSGERIEVEQRLERLTCRHRYSYQQNLFCSQQCLLDREC